MPLTSSLLSPSDLNAMRALIRSLPRRTTLVDFEEAMLIPAVRERTRLWRLDGRLAGFAYIDEYNNLWFELDEGCRSPELEGAIVAWGAAFMRARNATSGQDDPLDASLGAEHAWQAEMLVRHGFERSGVRSLRYRRSLVGMLPELPLPPGFWLRPALGEQEAEVLAELHRAAFGTEHMTLEERLAIMRAPGYLPELDLVAVAPDGKQAAFCICGLEEDGLTGYTDPVGTHPAFRRLGLAQALVAAGMHALQQRGVTAVTLGTSSENQPMQRLAESLGFTLVSEKLWFSKKIG
jgi:ribosomal protein S18 acetylase RimI-like enzyme